MSKRGPRPTVPAYRRSGFVRPPPIGRDAAEAAYGAPLPDAAWAAIVAAFDAFGQMLDVAAGPRLNADKNDPASFTVRRARYQRKLVKAFEAVVALQGEGELLATMRWAALDVAASEASAWLRGQRDDEAALVASMRRALGAAPAPASPWPVSLDATLDVAASALRLAVRLLVAGGWQPAVVDLSEADARQWLAREIVAALEAARLDTRLTDGRAATDGDLLPTERLLVALTVPSCDDRPDPADPDAMARWAVAVSKWIQRALKQP